MDAIVASADSSLLRCPVTTGKHLSAQSYQGPEEELIIHLGQGGMHEVLIGCGIHKPG